MDATQQGLRCRWAGCPDEFDDERDWIKHVAVHVFTLKSGERTPWLGPPELDPDLPRPSVVQDKQLDCEDEEERDFSQINALSSPASTPPQVELPESPGLAEKINGPSASAITTAQPFATLSIFERSLSHRTSASADDVEADLIPRSPTPSIHASQNANSNQSQESPLRPHALSSYSPPVPAWSQFPSADARRFRRGVFQASYSARTSVRPEPLMNASQSQSPLAATQTLQSPESSQTNGNDMGWLNTQAFRPPETQDLYESD